MLLLTVFRQAGEIPSLSSLTQISPAGRNDKNFSFRSARAVLCLLFPYSEVNITFLIKNVLASDIKS
jgi:hypothetical protein